MPRTATKPCDSYLVPKARLQLRPITLRIPSVLLEDITTLRSRAEQAGFVFDVQAAVIRALEETVERVGLALKRCETGSPSELGLECAGGGRGRRRRHAGTSPDLGAVQSEGSG